MKTFFAQVVGRMGWGKRRLGINPVITKDIVGAERHFSDLLRWNAIITTFSSGLEKQNEPFRNNPEWLVGINYLR